MNSLLKLKTIHNIMIKISKFLAILIIIFYSQTCFSQKEPNPVNEYESCCGTQPVEFSYEKKKVFVPNAFTPNGDGVNDYFIPFVNETVTDIWWFSIYSAKGDTLLYQSMYLDLKSDSRTIGWNGLRPDGTPYKGLFSYQMRIDDQEANKHIVEGFACAILCDSKTKILKTKDGCFYPSQSAGHGKLDKSKNNEEKGCFDQ